MSGLYCCTVNTTGLSTPPATQPPPSPHQQGVPASQVLPRPRLEREWSLEVRCELRAGWPSCTVENRFHSSAQSQHSTVTGKLLSLQPDLLPLAVVAPPVNILVILAVISVIVSQSLIGGWWWVGVWRDGWAWYCIDYLIFTY